MAADPSIFQQYLKPVRSVADYASEMDVREANALEMAAKRQAVADEQSLRSAYQQSGGDQNKLMQLLTQGGQYKAAQAMQKQLIENREGQGRVDKQKVDLIDAKLKQSRNYLDTVQTPDQYLAWHEANHSDPILGPELSSRGVTAEQARASILAAIQKPGGLEELINKSKLGVEKFTEMNKPTYQTRNLGGTTDTLQLPGMGGTPTVVSSIRNTQSPESIASTASARAGQAVTMRGQNLADARARESTAATVGKPFEVTGPDGTPVLVRQDRQGNITPVQGFGPKAAIEKPMTEGQSKAALFGSRMESANAVFSDLEKKGATTSVPGTRAGGGIGSIITALSSGKQQQLEQAKRDFINATLRRESGAAIASSEFDNAEKQYFPQIGDSPEVIRQKANNRSVAIRGVQAEVPKAQRGIIKEIVGSQSTAKTNAGATVSNW